MPLDVIENMVRDILNREMYYSQYGTAQDVDETKRTCTFVPAGDQAERFNIRFQAVASQTVGFVLVPKEGSDIAVTFVNKSTGFVALTTEIDKMLIDTDLTQFNGGDNGGLINIEPLTNKINALESKVNEIITTFNTHTHIASSFGAPTTPPPLPVTGVLTPTVRTDYEDKSFLH